MNLKQNFFLREKKTKNLPIEIKVETNVKMALKSMSPSNMMVQLFDAIYYVFTHIERLKN